MNTVRIRLSAPDPFAGLTGRDYIRTRGLRPLVGPMAAPRLADECTCLPCTQARQLPGILQLLERWERPAPITKPDTRVVPLRRKE